jgi:hypothetical protein
VKRTPEKGREGQRREEQRKEKQRREEKRRGEKSREEKNIEEQRREEKNQLNLPRTEPEFRSSLTDTLQCDIPFVLFSNP